jgi:hypothetical protein
MLDIDHCAQYLLHHGQTGSKNPVVGVVINYAYQVDRRSIFGFILGRALGPRQNKSHLDQAHPNQPYIEATGGTIAIQSMDRLLNAVGLTMDEVTGHLIVNGIPCTWVDHAYMFGLHYLNHYFKGKEGPFQDLYCETDQSRMLRSNKFRVPPAIPSWDGW